MIIEEYEIPEGFYYSEDHGSATFWYNDGTPSGWYSEFLPESRVFSHEWEPWEMEEEDVIDVKLLVPLEYLLSGEYMEKRQEE